MNAQPASMGKIMAIVVGGLAALIGVGALGFYLGANFRIVPVGQMPAPPEYTTAESQAASAPTPPTPPRFVPPSASRGNGPFTYRFTPGENLAYRLTADISGTGNERDLGVGGIGMVFNAGFGVATTAVDTKGIADVTVDFDDVLMTGHFMGDEINLERSDNGTSFSMPGANQSPEAQSQLKNTPQMQFFEQPIRLSVAPDGRILSAQGAPGIEQVLAPEHLIAATELPEADMQPGHTWTTDFNFPIPGFNLAVPAKAQNTFESIVEIEGRRVAVIHQVIEATQANGQIDSPAAFFGEQMNFSMPRFVLSGENYIYFDTALGKLRQADMDLTVGLEFGGKLDAFKNLVGAFGNLLDEIDGTKRNPDPDASAEAPLLDLGFQIRSSLMLQDSTQAPSLQ